MTSPADLLAHLRAHTRDAHDRLEALGLARGLTTGELDASGYARVLRWQRRAHVAVEGGLADFDWPGDYHYVPRANTLASEAIAPPAEPVRALSRPASLAAATGRAYVLEGSSLGGNAILGHLRDNPAVAAYAPFPFYAFQREVGLVQWRRFVAFAKTRAWSVVEAEEAATAAREVFGVFGRAAGQLV